MNFDIIVVSVLTAAQGLSLFSQKSGKTKLTYAAETSDAVKDSSFIGAFSPHPEKDADAHQHGYENVDSNSDETVTHSSFISMPSRHSHEDTGADDRFSLTHATFAGKGLPQAHENDAHVEQQSLLQQRNLKRLQKYTFG